jgi:hypothetical protein
VAVQVARAAEHPNRGREWLERPRSRRPSTRGWDRTGSPTRSSGRDRPTWCSPWAPSAMSTSSGKTPRWHCSCAGWPRSPGCCASTGAAPAPPIHCHPTRCHRRRCTPRNWSRSWTRPARGGSRCWPPALIRAEFIIGVAGCTLPGVRTLLSGSGWMIALGIWPVATGMNHVPPAISAQALSRPGALEAELVGADLPRELRQAGVRQLWIVVPFAVVVAAIAHAWSGRRPSMGDRQAEAAAY